MLRQASRLIPFEQSVPLDVQITAELVWKSDGWLELSYGVLALATAGITPLVLPEGLMDGPQHGQYKDELWTTTCFEAFLGLPGQESYWEINLSPCGDWAVYRFTDYRSGQEAQPLRCDPHIQLQRRHHQLRLDARLPLAPWWSAGVCPELSLTAVIDKGAEGLSHWALRHGEQADFHDRNTFLKP